jgi:hypothetical protein
MYKKYSAEDRAIRIGLDLGLNLDNDHSNGAASSYHNDNSFVEISVSIGKELQRPISTTRWVWFYGGDIVPFYQSRINNEFYDNNMDYSNDYQSIGIGLRPFLGIRFNINQKLYLSVETSLNLKYAYSKQLYKRYNPDEIIRDTEGDNISLNVSPASGLFLYYKF